MAASLRMKLRMALCLINLGHIGYGKYRLLLPGSDYKIFVATSVKFDEQVFDLQLMPSRR
jgi:hypothetical protein